MDTSSGMSASDVALLSGRHDDWAGNSFMWIFALLILAGGGFGGFGGNNFANAIGYENLATSSEVQRGFDNQNSMANQREILTAVNAGTAQAVATTNQVFHDTVQYVGDKYNELDRDILGVSAAVQQAIANQNDCCCSTKMLIQETSANQRYEAAMQANAIIQAIREEGAATRAQSQQDKIESLQQQVQQLQLAQAVQGVVRYPDSWAYNAGNNPFCGCNNGYNNNI